MAIEDKEIKQEIQWLKEEIELDEALRGTSAFSEVEQRLADNRAMLHELEGE